MTGAVGDRLRATLRDAFGFDGFRPGQEDAARAAHEGRDALVVMPTGAGKSLTYQLPALCRDDLTLVVSPLVSLMRDQVDQLNGRVGDAEPAGLLSGQQDPSENRATLDRAVAGGLRLLYVAPERFGSAAFLDRIRRARVGLFVVDEAHCVSQWGHDFRPDYFRLADAARWLGATSILAATATATPRVAADIERRLRLDDPVRVRTGFDRPNLTFAVRRCAGRVERRGRLLAALRDGGGAPTLPAIVYAGTRDNAERLAAELAPALGVEALAYHAGLDRDARDAAQRRFMAGEVPLVCATNAFGMGVDKADVRTVVHDCAPASIEAWYQEAGRAGRDGGPARAILLADGRDKGLHRFFIDRAETDEATLDRIAGGIQRATVDGRYDVAVGSLDGDGDRVRAVVGHLTQVGMVQPAPGPPDRVRGRLRGAYDARVRADVAALAREAQEQRWAQYHALWRFVESDACRRRAVLDHFGDRATIDPDALSAPCCDACVPLVLPDAESLSGADPRGAGRRASAGARDAARRAGARRRGLTDDEADAVDRSILEVARDAAPPVGRTRIVEVLRGGRSRRLLDGGYDGLPAYARHAEVPARTVLERVDALVDAGALRSSGGPYPVLTPTDDG
ncbi:MAG: ATP-dependent DNA helicase [Solirubrobacteraceae bacterium]|nr:ATP-dependent DNA helicase [Solirubrobacteraceae bacterium]